MHLDVFRYSSPSSPTIGQLKEGLFLFDGDFQSVQEEMISLNIQAICDHDDNFPSKARRMKPQPYILYYQGDISLLERPTLGIVGPRKPSLYANKILDRLFKTAQQYNVVTVSGLAPGVDQLTHRLSIERGIPTIAVLGGGLTHYLHRSDRHLIASIVEHGGLVISEFRLSQKPETYTFPQRNRIIAGLSDALFVPEAGKKSGSLITVDFADKMGISIYGTPCDIYSPESQGLHEQMASGIIKPIFDFNTLFSRHFSAKKNVTKANYEVPNLTPSESEIISCLRKSKSCSLDYLSNKIKISTSSLLSTITLLEMKELVIQDVPGVYSLG